MPHDDTEAVDLDVNQGHNVGPNAYEPPTIEHLGSFAEVTKITYACI